MGPRPTKHRGKPKSKAQTGWLQNTKNAVAAHIRAGPADAEIRGAIKTFRAPGALCYLEGLETNEGFGISASFNPVRHRSAGGTLELAPKAVNLRFEPKEPLGWSWCHSAVAFGKEIAREVSVRMTDSLSRSKTDSGSGKVSLQQKAKATFPLLGSVGLEATEELAGSSAASDSAGQVREFGTVERQDFAEFNRDRRGFALSLSSPDRKDLVRLNPELNRLSVLAPPSDQSVDVKAVKVTMGMRTLRQDDGVEHAFAVREATGCWAPLARSTNKKIITELLFSKFLEPLHRSTVLWPPKEQ